MILGPFIIGSILVTAMIYLPVEGGVESVKVVFSFGGFFLGSSLSLWTWSLVASPEVVIKNTKLIQGYIGIL